MAILWRPERSVTLLLIARHGNTFEEGETPRRVGRRTDLPLTAKGQAQALAVGMYLKNHGIIPDAIFSAPLERTRRTADLARSVLPSSASSVQNAPFLTEIDYGPDENRPEDAVIARIGRAALDAWEKDALPPPGWNVDPPKIIRDWHDFAKECTGNYPDGAILAVTSNGIARFALSLTEDFEAAHAVHGLKLATGALGILRCKNDVWHVEDWNIRPPLNGGGA